MNRFIRTEHDLYVLAPVTVESTPTPEPEVTHHVLIGDRSGSMYYDIEKWKTVSEQALTVKAADAPNVESTLITFSSHRDCTTHWAKVPVGQVADFNQPYLGQLRAIRASALTGISQALNQALAVIDKAQTTAITLFTDGYANDPSSHLENQAIDAFIKECQTNYPNVFVNVIGYRDWCDWPRMNKLANSLSGKCFKARTFQDVLSAMEDVQALLSGDVRPATVIASEAGTMTVAINRTTGQVNASESDLRLSGISEGDEIEVFRVRRQDRTKHSPKGAQSVATSDPYLFGAVALAYLGTGSVRTAKDILYSSGNKTLWNEHQSAMTPSSLAGLLSDLTEWVKAGNEDAYEMGRNTRPPHNLFDLANAINSLPAKSLGIDTDSFYKNYRRRSVKKVPGKRNPDGSITPPSAEMVPRDGARVYIRGMDFNTSDASVQIGTEQAMWLKRTNSGKVIKEVSFVSLDDLKDYRSFTLLSSGERNVEVLPLEVYTKEAWDALRPFMLPHKAVNFTPGQRTKIVLKRFRMEADACPTADEIQAAITVRDEAEAHVKILSAMQNKEASSPYTAEQLSALRDVHLTPALYFSAPSHTHYSDKDEAVSQGLIDSFTRYKVNFGTSGILNKKAFRSGNAFLARHFVVTLKGNEVVKPKLDTYLMGADFTEKTPRGAVTEADKLMLKVAREILINHERLDNDGITSWLNNEKKKVTEANATLQSLVMEIGCTGLIPRELESQTQQYNAEGFSKAAGVKLKKAEKEGMFWTLPNGVVISVTPETAWYTVKTAAGAQAAAK